MKILCHRGYWKKEQEKNTLEAIRRALECGFGFESDIRDYNGQLVISHNIADQTAPLAEEVFCMLAEYGGSNCFAINIKADGLDSALMELLKRYHISNYFAFDMSAPQMYAYKETGITCFTRQSEWESQPVLYQSSAGVWVDAFEEDGWITKALLTTYLQDGKKICLVSPELHGRDAQEFWGRIRSYGLLDENMMLCTDMPDEAEAFFMGQ